MHGRWNVYKMGWKSVRRGGEEQKGKEEKKEQRERMRRKGERKREKRKPAFRLSELIGPRSKVHIFDKDYAPKGRDSSYFGLFSNIRAVGFCLYPKELFDRILKYGNATLF